MYSHQESPLVHLLWYKIQCWFFSVLVRFHTALFASEPEIVNTTTRVLKVIHSLVHPFNCTRVHLLSPHRVRLLYSHLAKRSAPKGETNVSSIQSNQTRQVWIFFALIPHLFIRYENCVMKKTMKTPCKLFNIETDHSLDLCRGFFLSSERVRWYFSCCPTVLL